jgi:hypothetical protein
MGYTAVPTQRIRPPTPMFLDLIHPPPSTQTLAPALLSPDGIAQYTLIPNQSTRPSIYFVAKRVNDVHPRRLAFPYRGFGNYSGAPALYSFPTYRTWVRHATFCQHRTPHIGVIFDGEEKFHLALRSQQTQKTFKKSNRYLSWPGL